MELFTITLMENEIHFTLYFAHTEHLPSVSTLEVGKVGGSGEQSLLCGDDTASTDKKKYDQSIVGLASNPRLELHRYLIAWGKD